MDKNSPNYKLPWSRSLPNDSNGLAERRKNNRYALFASVDFKWEDADGNDRGGAGFMRDVSLGGLFVMSDTPPPVGTAINLEINPMSASIDSPPFIQAKGQVCRVEPDDQLGMRWGFASSTKLKIRNRLKLPK